MTRSRTVARAGSGVSDTAVLTVVPATGPQEATADLALDLSDRVLLVAAYRRTNLTKRQIGPLFGISHSAAHRVIDTLGPLLALASVRRRNVVGVVWSR